MIKRSLSLIFSLCLALTAISQSSPDIDEPDIEKSDSIDEDVDIDDITVRENPVIDEDDDYVSIAIPSFIKLNRNHIDFNGADWARLRNDVHHSSEIPFTIVHIGDSHIQADFATGEIRNNLQYDYGNAGRGLITPLKMSGTNEPHDYSFSSTQAWNAVKLMNQSWPRTMGFTGTSITPVSTSSNFLVGTSDKYDYNPFSAITVYHNGQFYVTSIVDKDGNAIPFVATPSKDYTHIALTKDVNEARIYFDSAGDLTIFGTNLSGQRPGIFYHTIGNNGATYDTYNRIGNVGEGIQPLKPNLIILSLGTNEAFGRVDKRHIEDAINRLVENISKNNPDAILLLVTPMECQRSVYTTVKVPGKTRKKRKGRKSKTTTVTKRVHSYATNTNISTVRDIIVNYGKEHHIAVYDWYTIAGGEKASSKWISDGLFSRDRVHHSLKGYRLQGELMYQAIKAALDGTNN